MNKRAILLFSFLFLFLPLFCLAQEGLPVPQLRNPANGSEVSLSHIRTIGLQWDVVPGASKYEIEITGPMSFNNGFPYTTSTTSTTLVFGQGGVIDTTFMGTYYWRVRAILGDEVEGLEGPFSETWTFIVTTLPTPTPTPVVLPTPQLDINHDNVVDFRDVFFMVPTWTDPPEQRSDLRRFEPYFSRRKFTPTPTPTPSMSAPSSLQVLVDGKAIPPGEGINTEKVGSILLDWADVAGSEPITYDVSVVGPKPQASVSYYGLSASEVRPYGGYQGLYPGAYTWSVQAVDGLGRRSAVSTSEFQLETGSAPPLVINPSDEPEYDLDSDGRFQAGDLLRFSRYWATTAGQGEFSIQADYDRDGTVGTTDAARLIHGLSSEQLAATRFTTIDLYNPPQGDTPASLNRTIPALSPLALRIFELAFCEIHFEPVEGAIDYEVTLVGVTNDGNWPIGSRSYTGGELSITFMLSGRYTPTSPGVYHITVRAIDPHGIPGVRSPDLDIALSSW